MAGDIGWWTEQEAYLAKAWTFQEGRVSFVDADDVLAAPIRCACALANVAARRAGPDDGRHWRAGAVPEHGNLVRAVRAMPHALDKEPYEEEPTVAARPCRGWCDVGTGAQGVESIAPSAAVAGQAPPLPCAIFVSAATSVRPSSCRDELTIPACCHLLVTRIVDSTVVPTMSASSWRVMVSTVTQSLW